MLHYRVAEWEWEGRAGEGMGCSDGVGGGRQLHLSFVSFQQEREGEVELFQKYRQSWHMRERGRGRDGGREREGERVS